ncbi:Trehalose-phosphatase [Handroanthus impetiginosus]|uniref:Trehalose 6-phosphate phosphatase n=1 Tax=Handroanthus impetiginosus TaxID=429701 RepID=A0A2G9GH26_9LAMI|nr:Trehalose-phosphatase [Handroanthus impetiginosus]
MDLKSTKASPILADPAPINKSRPGIHSSLFPYSQSGPSFSTTKLDDVQSNGWLDAMKSSSPPHKKAKDLMNRYPSTLKSFETIMDRARNRKLVMFLDYDGTLSPIVDDPDPAFMSNDMWFALKSVAKYFPTAIISGRSLYKLVGLKELYYAGSHGMDIMFPMRDTLSKNHRNCQGKEVNLFQPPSEFLPMINEVVKNLIEILKDIKGAKVENHKFCVSAHYRNVDENGWPVIPQYVHDILKDYPRLRLTHRRKIKLDLVGFSNRHDVLPIYIGDDKTDEDAFKVLKKRNRGYGILVSNIPKESNAVFSLRDTAEMRISSCFLLRPKSYPFSSSVLLKIKIRIYQRNFFQKLCAGQRLPRIPGENGTRECKDT